MQLAQVHFKLGQDEQTLAVLALAYRKQLLDDPSDIRWLSSMYSNASVPYKAAEVLEKGIRDGIVESGKDNWTAVADAWYAAQELDRALLAYEEAGRVSSDGRSDLRLAYILSDLERWAEAREALERALEKGGLKANERGEAYLLKGLSRFNLGDFEGAGADWVEARRFENTNESARQWLNHLREERRREAS
jgi:tetratricopeptide (TPR) repeat protein